jgi:23S rRNA (cytosine1962-C5)-methyltransferase
VSEISIANLLEKAIKARRDLFDARHETAFRLFNGFSEGCPDLVVDLYAATVILNNYADQPEQAAPLIQEAQMILQRQLPWLKAGILKTRNAASADKKRGQLIFGEKPDGKIKEHNIWYAVDLTMNRDASLYLDTRNLRKWIVENMKDKTVLNAFAYTGSLGVAAMAGGASRVVQLDRNRRFLNLAKDSYLLNGFPIAKSDFISGDFWVEVGRMKRAGQRFDCVIVDPPFFAATSKGVVNQERDSARLINKVRPLIEDGGYLAAVNNALYVSGREYMTALETLCKDGYLQIHELIPVPEDFIGFAETSRGNWITDPAPFNHSTKIAILKVKRKRN